MIVLPTMHKRIRRSFLRLVLLFGALGVLMVTGITIAGRVPSELIRMNYDSIAYAQEMVRAMNGIRFPELYRDTDTLGWEKRFADTLEQASGNITEEAERKVITDLQASWDAYRQTPDDANYRGLHARIDALVQVNERGMFLRLSKNARFRDIMMAVTAAAFLLGTFWAFLLADSVAERLAHPCGGWRNCSAIARSLGGSSICRTRRRWKCGCCSMSCPACGIASGNWTS